MGTGSGEGSPTEVAKGKPIGTQEYIAKYKEKEGALAKYIYRWTNRKYTGSGHRKYSTTVVQGPHPANWTSR